MPTTDFSDFHFARPWWLLALLALALMLWWLRQRKNTDSNWRRFCAPHVLDVLLTAPTALRKSYFLYMLAFVGTVSILSLAGPVWEKLPQPTFVESAPLVIGLDLSRSMTATDLEPDRLARARFKITDLLVHEKARKQVALIVYAGEAYTLVPFTEDLAIFDLYMQSLDGQIMPVAGSRPDLFLHEVSALLTRAEVNNSDILLVTDFADDRAIEQARQLKSQGHRLSVLAVGTEQGAPIRSPSGDFILDDQGELVLANLTERSLQAVAAQGGGLYRHIDMLGSKDVEDLHRLLSEPVNPIAAEQIEKITSQWQERGPWLLFLVLPFVVMCFRRGVMVMMVHCSGLYVLLMPLQPAHAFGPEELWLNPDQRGAKVLQQGDAEAAAELFEDKRWKAAAYYRAGDYDQALEVMSAAENASDWYNRGNAFVGKGDYEKAIAAYSRALALEENFADAIHNRNIAIKLLEMQQKVQQQAQAQAGEEDESDQGEQEGQQAQQQGDQRAEQPQPNDDGEDMGEEQQTQAAESDERDEEAGDEEQSRDSEQQDNVETMSEEEQMLEQKLQHVPGNPKDFLRRKLQHLSQSRNSPGQDKSAAPDRPGDHAW